MRYSLVVVLSAFFLLPAPAIGQSEGAVEWGVDLGLSITDTDADNVTAFSIPTGRLRIGFHVSDQVAIEPRVAFNYLKAGDNDIKSLDLTAALLYSLSSTFYLFGEGGLVYLDAGDSDTEAQFGGGVGFRNAIDDDFGARFEFGVLIVDDDPIFSASAGLSFFRGGN